MRIKDKSLLTAFLKASEAQVYDMVQELGRIRKVKDVLVHEDFVYLPGTREDRILLVAHADTVRTREFKKPGANIVWQGDVCVSAFHDMFGWQSGGSEKALGADDRAGCAAMFALFDGGHSFLLTNGEERGMIGARSAVKEIGAELKKHQFALEIDRRGDRQIVFYDVATKEFEKHILDSMYANDPDKKLWARETGSGSDISVICDAVGICGANLAAGYWGEHGNNEMLLLTAWRHTVSAIKGFLAQEKHAAFPLPPRVPYVQKYPQYHNGHSSHHSHNRRNGDHWNSRSTDANGQGTHPLGLTGNYTHPQGLNRQISVKNGTLTIKLSGYTFDFAEEIGKRQAKNIVKRIRGLANDKKLSPAEVYELYGYLLQRVSDTALKTAEVTDISLSVNSDKDKFAKADSPVVGTLPNPQIVYFASDMCMCGHRYYKHDALGTHHPCQEHEGGTLCACNFFRLKRVPVSEYDSLTGSDPTFACFYCGSREHGSPEHFRLASGRGLYSNRPALIPPVSGSGATEVVVVKDISPGRSGKEHTQRMRALPIPLPPVQSVPDKPITTCTHWCDQCDGGAGSAWKHNRTQGTFCRLGQRTGCPQHSAKGATLGLHGVAYSKEGGWTKEEDLPSEHKVSDAPRGDSDSAGDPQSGLGFGDGAAQFYH
jgi:hypothetical protein